jgi:hypothetical protein
MSNVTTGTGIAWGKVGMAVAVVTISGIGIWSLTHGPAEPAKPAERVRAAAPAPQVVPTYAALLTPSMPAGSTAPTGATDTAQKPVTGTGRIRPREKSYEQKMWESHLAAGVGGDAFPSDAPQPGATAAPGGMASIGYAPGGCALAPTIPIAMQVESAGYTERGGMLNGLIVSPALGLGMNCTVLPAGTRVTMEFWGEIGDSQIMEIGFPTFVAPSIGAIQPKPIAGAPEQSRNTQLPDYLSGWVMTPTLSLDAGDVITLHLRGELHAATR